MKKHIIAGMCLVACLSIFNMNMSTSYAAETTAAATESSEDTE